MRVLVTGATGFLGGAVARALHGRGHRVLASGRNHAQGVGLSRDGLRFLAAELCQREAAFALCRDVDAVVHCAALSSPWGSERAFVRCNVDATEALLAGCLEAGVRRFVHISSPSVYMGGGDREGVREDDPLPRPVNHYAATKRASELCVQAAARRGIASVILRPRAIFGPGDSTIFPRLLRALETGHLPVIGDGQNRVDLTYIDNAVQAVERALTAPAPACGQIYNVSNGEPVLLWDVVRWLSAQLGLPAPRGSIPRALAHLAAAALEFVHRGFWPELEPTMTRYGVDVLTCTMTLDIERARSQLGYAPTVSVQEGLARFVTWWKERT